MAQQQKSKMVRYGTFVLFGFLVLSFGLWGIGDIFRGSSHTQVVATVGDQEITRQVYDQSLENEVRSIQETVGTQLTREQLAAIGVQDRALQPLIIQALMNQLAEDRGLVVTEAQLLAQIQREPAFQVNGKFDPDTYRLALRNANMSEPQFLSRLSFDVVRESLFDPLTEGVGVPDSTARLLFAHLAETRTAQFVLIESATQTTLPAPTDADLQQTYEDYAADFQAPEYRSVTLLRIQPSDFYSEVEVTETEARERYEATKATFDVAEKRGIKQIVYDDKAGAEAALAEAKAGKTLEEIATARGTSVAQIGVQSEAQLAGAGLPTLATAIFAVPAGEKYGIAESQLGWHLFEVVTVESGRASTFEEVKDKVTQTIRDERANEALSSVVAQANEEFGTGATLDEVAQKLSLPLVTIEAVDRDGKDRAGAYVDAIPSPPETLPLLFAGEDFGIDSALNAARDGTYYAYRVDAITPPATRPYDEVKAEVLALWERLQRDTLAKTKAEALAAEIAGGKTLSQVATENGWVVESSKPMTRTETAPEVTPAAGLPAKLFAAKVGEVVTVPAEGGTLLAVLTEITPLTADQDAERFKNLTESYRQSLANDLANEMTRALQQEYKVEKFPAVLDEALAGY